MEIGRYKLTHFKSLSWHAHSLVSLTHSLTHPLTHLLTHLLTHSLIHSLTHSPLTHSLTCLTYSFTHSPANSLTHSFTSSITHSFIHSFIHSFTHPLTHSPAHSFTRSLIHPLTHPLKLIPRSLTRSPLAHSHTQAQLPPYLVSTGIVSVVYNNKAQIKSPKECKIRKQKKNRAITITVSSCNCTEQ